MKDKIKLEGFDVLYTYETNLPHNIFIDDCQSYKTHNHNLCFLVLHNDIFYPFSIVNGEIICENETPFNEEIYIKLGKCLVNELIMCANEELFIIDMLHCIQKFSEKNVVNDEKPWSMCGNERNGFVKVQQKDQKFNFFNTIENRIVFGVWFEELGDLFFFDKIPFTFGCVDGVWKKVTVDGNIVDV